MKLANRVQQLKKEEEKAAKRIKETKKRAEEIKHLRKRNGTRQHPNPARRLAHDVRSDNPSSNIVGRQNESINAVVDRKIDCLRRDQSRLAWMHVEHVCKWTVLRCFGCLHRHQPKVLLAEPLRAWVFEFVLQVGDDGYDFYRLVPTWVGFWLG